MRLEYQKDFHSIKFFEPVDLPEFSILTGLNGSGKTQLLQAIENQSIKVDSIPPEEIIYFELMDFKVNNEPGVNSFTYFTERDNAWRLIQQEIGSFGNLKNNLLAVKNRNFTKEEVDKLKDISSKTKKVLFQLTEKEVLDSKLYEKLLRYKPEATRLFSNKDLKAQQHVTSLEFLMKNYPIFLDEITLVEFHEFFEPVFLQKHFLPTQIGQLFLQYRTKEHSEIEKLTRTIKGDSFELADQARRNVAKRYDGKTPWEVINEFLGYFNNFEYTISYPKELTLNEINSRETKIFTPKLENKDKTIQIDYNLLSSGEKILFALALCMFKSKSDKFFPKLLLLDEIDATLHPSMVENLLDLIKDVFLPKGTKVILATHSPTTIAKSQDDEIFVVNKQGKIKIEKSDRKTALSTLTEGFATLQEGMLLLDQISKKDLTIITEGTNTEYFEKASNYFANDIKESFHILKGIESITGKTELELFWKLFKSVPHEKKVLFVWDPDADEYRKLKNEKNTFAYVFKKNEANFMAETGIENLFNPKFFEGFTSTTLDDATGKIIDKKFNKKRYKTTFLEKMMAEDESAFSNFKPLFDYIQEIIKSDKP